MIAPWANARQIYNKLSDLRKITPARVDSDIRFVRGLAFTHKCRHLAWPEMIDHLIAVYEPLARIERVAERLTA